MPLRPVVPRLLLAVLIAAGALAGCGEPSEGKLIADVRAALEKKDHAAALVQLKSILQRNAQSTQARYLLGTLLLQTGDAAGAAVELQKAKELGHPEDQVVPKHAEALLVQGLPKKAIELYGATKLGDKKADAALQATLAGAHLEMGDDANAAAAIESSLAQDPANTVAQLFGARRAAAKGDIDDALRRVDAILAATPARVDALLFKGDLLWRGKGQTAEALQVYRDALAKDGRYLPTHTAMLRLLLQLGRTQEFREQLASLRGVAPTHAATRYFETQLALLDRDFPRARTSLQSLLQVAPNDAAVLQLAGLVEFQGGAPKLAESYLVKSLQLSPNLVVARRLLAETHLRTGQAAKALQVLQPLLERKERDAEVYGLTARAHLMLGDWANAERFFTRAVETDPNDTRSRTAVALTRISRGDVDAGFHLLESLAATDKTAYVDLALISARLQRNDLDGALVAIDRFIAKSGDKALPHLLRGRTMLARNDLVAARASFDKALAADAANFPSVQGLVAVDLAERKVDSARKRYEDFLSREPKNASALLALAQLRQSVGDKPEAVESLLVDAVKANPSDLAPRLALVEQRLQRLQTKAAIDAAQEAVAALPEEWQAQDALGRAQLAAGDVRQALSTFNKIAAQRPNDPQPQLRLAEAYLGSNDTASATQSLRRALTIKPDLVAAQRGLVKVAVAEKRIDDALQIARQVQKQRPKEAVGFQMEGEILQNQRRTDAALVAFKAALDREPTTVNATRLHAMHAGAGREPVADRIAEAWLRDHPRDTAFLFYLGTAAVTRSDFKTAEDLYRKVLAIDASSASTLNNLAWLLVKQGKPGAVALAQQAAQLAPDNAAFMDTLASAYAADKQWPQAIDWQRKSIARDPQAHVLKLNLARHLIASGDRQGARAELEKLVALGSAFDRQADVAAMLKTL